VKSKGCGCERPQPFFILESEERKHFLVLNHENIATKNKVLRIKIQNEQSLKFIEGNDLIKSYIS
jgi:hypothetical protein